VLFTLVCPLARFLVSGIGLSSLIGDRRLTEDGFTDFVVLLLFLAFVDFIDVKRLPGLPNERM